ncbi:unnamed protein product [Larinioides sclopetarius]|uniref:MAM domain-containing protein n=1 Tax=Larinioides sclopetarius TaxID=280406 RepID=A0AAV2AAP0_9ARAC
MIRHLPFFKSSLFLTVQLVLLIQCWTGIFTANEVLLSCSFTAGTCGMFNRPDSRAHWSREYLTIGGRYGYAMVVRGNTASNHFARLQTPHLSTNDVRSGCMRFRYFISGRTPASLSVIKQGFVTQYIFANARKTEDHWESAELDVEFLGDKVMFYFEADTRVQDYGDSVVAFTELTITTGSCQNKHYIG